MLLTFGFTAAFGQGLYRLAEGNELHEVELVYPGEEGLYIFEVTPASEYKLHVWDGFKYTDNGLIPNIPKHGVTSQEDFRIVDALYFDGKLFVLGHDFGPIQSSSPTRVLTWDGSAWNDITTNEVTQAYSATKLIEFNKKLCVLGIFPTTGILAYENSNWVTLGNRLGVNSSADYVLDAETYRGRIYATGEFTRPLSGQRYNTAIFENNEWRPVVTPPFIGKSKHFDIVKGELILTGEANVEFDYLKSFDGIGWTDISAGLDDVMITEFWDISGTDDMLCLTGIFENKRNGLSFNYLTKDADGWHFGDNAFTSNPIKLVERNNKIFAYGEFKYDGVQAIGQIGSNSAMISGKVYFDENDDCIQDGDEPGLYLTKVVLNPGNLVTYTNAYGNYEFPVEPGSYSITFEPGVKNRYGCGRIVTVNVANNINYVVPELNAVEVPNIVDLELSSQLLNGWKLVKGQYNEIKLTAYNNGSVTIDGATLQMKMGDWWEDVSITPTPSSIVEDEYTWNVSNLEKGQRYEITIKGNIKASLSEYNDFCFTGDVNFPQKDVAIKSNREAAQLTSVDDLGPISKQVDCGSWYSTTTDYITYQIRFENESNQSVNKIMVLDTFDSDLITTHVWDYTDLGSSTDLDIKMIKVPGKQEWRLIYTWNTTNANLAPTGGANGKDVGYAIVKFELHDLSKSKGIELCNQALVQIENSEPVRTNTVCSKATSLNIPGVQVPSQVAFYPNPADQNITLSNGSSESRAVEVMNQMGQVIEVFELQAFEEKEVEVSSWASGVYMVRIPGYETQKLVIQ